LGTDAGLSAFAEDPVKNGAVTTCLSLPFSSICILTDALFWDRRRPRLHNVATQAPLANGAGEDACGPRRARPIPWSDY